MTGARDGNMIPLPAWRPARITAEVFDKGDYYVYADKRCIDQGQARNQAEATAHIRERWIVEPRPVTRKPYVKKVPHV